MRPFFAEFGELDGNAVGLALALYAYDFSVQLSAHDFRQLELKGHALRSVFGREKQIMERPPTDRSIRTAGEGWSNPSQEKSMSLATPQMKRQARMFASLLNFGRSRLRGLLPFL